MLNMSMKKEEYIVPLCGFLGFVPIFGTEVSEGLIPEVFGGVRAS